jgi:galactofuranosylgalactofuranosylrhamnosyl-N-acetylglucosaminyl-diphospho-decaprenol beta-1,5/1,6-galactofuranosyltransferase
MAEVVVQRVIFSDAADRQPLYAILGERATDHRRPAVVSRRSVRVPAGDTLSTDTYFNALFEHVWLRLCAVRWWRLHVSTTGSGVLKVTRHGPESGVRSIVASRVVADRCDTAIDIDVAPGQRGATRLSFEIEAGNGEMTLHEASWRADIDAVSRVALVAGFCCFNNEDLVLANVSSLLADDALWEVVSRLVLVDQSGKGALAAAIPLLPRSGGRVAVVEQGNFGGSGGFARVMSEALAQPGATHVLMMDDDVALEPECLRRTAMMFAMTLAEIAVGGQMLDLASPTVIHEAGARVLTRKLQVRALCRGSDATTESTLDSLMQDPEVDYNAWFYFSAPLESVTKVGLPVPFFINFDDVEYGIRLRRAGVQLISPPGIAIWHRTGADKETRWRAYYYQRNVLIINAQYGLCSRHRVARIFLKRWLSAITRRDVVRPGLACQAVRDYLAGATAIDPQPDRFCSAIRRMCGAAPRKCNNPVTLLAAAAGVAASALRLWVEGPMAAKKWRRAATDLRTVDWWRTYLRIDGSGGEKTNEPRS